MPQVTHSDELVTKTDLSNFYQGILPYLGGMPEMLANKFSKSDIYSETEKMIGQWIDGKPLYQKTVTGTVSSGWGDTAHNVANIDTVVKVDCGIIHSNSYVEVGGAYASDGKFLCQVGRTNVALYAAPSTYAGDGFICTFQYTKTTDSAISIGNDTDYSTTEKIVGTWIDGKPVYQKTVTGVCPSTSKDGTLVNGKLSNDALTDADVIVSIQGVLLYTSSGNSMPLPWTTSGGYMVQALVDGTDKCVYIGTKASSYNGKPARVTVQYTKTTD